MAPILSLCVAIALTFSGCFWKAQVKPSEKPFDLVITFVDDAVFKSGGTAAFTPLKAGPGALADERSDRVSANIITAITDRLAQGPTSLTVAAPENVSDLILRGYIEDLSRRRLAISGEIYLSSTGAKAMSFAGYARLDKHTNVFQAAGILGAALADEIASHAAKE